MKPVVVVGGSVAGLSTALFLANRDVPVTVLEQDPTPMARDGHRRATPQAAHSHAFLARSRSILAAEAPDVLTALRAAGVRETTLRPPDGGGEADEVVVLNARRATFEWALRTTAAKHPGIDLRVGVGVDGLDLPHGVRTKANEAIEASVVVDAAGKRSTLHAMAATRDVPCGIAYLTRFYRLRDGEPTSLNRGFTHGASFDRYSCLVFPADDGNFSVTFGILPEDKDLRALLDPAAFDAAARSIPIVAPWVDPDVAEPTTGVALMTSLHNVLRPPDGTLGIHAVGDARCVTNPAHTRGCTLALLAAQHVAVAIAEHPTDLRAQADRMAELCAGELADWVEDSVAQDAARLVRWRPDVEPDRPLWTGAVTNGEAYLASQRDPVAWRSFTRLQNAVDRPRAVLDDPALVDAVARVAASGWRPDPIEVPSHDDLVAVAAAAAAAA